MSTTAEDTPRTAFKVLREGKSWHGGTYDWPLPTQASDGSWVPGAWTPDREPVRCESGYHLTRDPARWWGDGEVTAYLAEYDGATDSTSGTDERDPTKFAVQRSRLLRPLTDAELRTHGIYLSGEVEEFSSGRLVLGGTVRVKRLCGSAIVGVMSGSASVGAMCDSARVDGMCGSASVGAMHGSASVGAMHGSARVDAMRDSTRVDGMYGSARVGVMYGSARVGVMYGSASVGAMHDSASVGVMRGSARVGVMCDLARVDGMCGSASVGAMHVSASVGAMHDSASVGAMYGSSSADARSDAVVVLKDGTPTAVLRGAAVMIDRRGERPVVHVAPKTGSLVIAPDGTVRHEAAEVSP